MPTTFPPLSLCDSFKWLAEWTDSFLRIAETVRHQLLEETFTDLHLLHLKRYHGHEVKTLGYNKRQEGKHGADWEWWFTNPAKSSWVGLRIQAKVIELHRNQFAHLHYRNPNSKVAQIDQLESQARRKGVTPLYCFYLRIDTPNRSAIAPRLRSLPTALFGCSLTTVAHVRTLQPGKMRALVDVLPGAWPWHLLACASQSDLPSHVWQVMQDIGADTLPTAAPRPNPPGYVLQALNANFPVEDSDSDLLRTLDDGDDPDLAGVVVIVPDR